MCTVMLTRHVNIAAYNLSSFGLTFILNGPNMSTAQYVKCAASSNLS